MPKEEKKEPTVKVEAEAREPEELTDEEKEFIGKMQELEKKIDSIDEEDLRYFQYEQSAEIFKEHDRATREFRMDIDDMSRRAIEIRDSVLGKIRGKEKINTELAEFWRNKDRFSEREQRELKLEDKARQLALYKREIERNEKLTEEDKGELMAEIENVKEELRAAKRTLVEEYSKREAEEEERKAELGRLREEIRGLVREEEGEREEKEKE